MKEDYKIIFGLQPLLVQGQEIYFVEAFIALCKAGTPQYIDKKVTPEILKSIDLVPNPIETKILEEIKAYNLEDIVSKYPKVRGKQRTIFELFLDETIKTAVISKLDRTIKNILSWCLEQKYFTFYLDVQRKVYLPHISIQLLNIEAKAKAYFVKTALGMTYALKLVIGTDEITPSTSDIDIIANDPMVLRLNNFLIQCNQIISLKIKPFLSKSEIFIDKTKIRSYFSNNFMKEIVTRIEVEAEGFDFNNHHLKPEPILKFHENLISSNIEASLSFKYGDYTFSSPDFSKNKVIILTSENSDPEVHKYHRNHSEEAILANEITALGLVKNDNGRYGLPETNDAYDILYFIAKHKVALEKFVIQNYKLEDKEISLEKGEVELSSQLVNDWFDINMIVKVGDEHIPFIRFIDHIKVKNRFYHLSNGEIFIIPSEWMTKYQLLAELATIEGEHVKLKKSQFTVLDDLQGFNPSEQKPLEVSIPKSLKATLRPYQEEGAKWLISHYENRLGACLADDMGLGKTLQTICLLLHIKDHIKTSTSPSIVGRQLSLFEAYEEARSSLKALVVLPASLIYNWESELVKFSPQLMVKKHLGSLRAKKHHEIEHFDVILTTYQTAHKDENLLSKIDFSVIVLDESHYIKNKDSKIFKSLSTLKALQKVSLSGTPIENSLNDLWSQMQFINPNILGSFKYFTDKFKTPIERHKDSQRIQELKMLLDPYILRRTKKEVIQDLPEVDEQFFFTEMSLDQAKLYEQEKSAVRNQVLDIFKSEDQLNTNKIHILNALMRLRQIANHPKLVGQELSSGKFENITETLMSLVLAQHKVLVFSSFVSHLKLVEEFLNAQNIKFVKLTGEDVPKERNKAVETFSKDEDCSIFLMSIKAGGVGLNLTNANYVLILDPWWNPFVELQALARAHRIGQQNKVTFLRFISKYSIEEKIIQLQKSKMELANKFIAIEYDLPLDRATLENLLS